MVQSFDSSFYEIKTNMKIPSEIKAWSFYEQINCLLVTQGNVFKKNKKNNGEVYYILKLAMNNMFIDGLGFSLLYKKLGYVTWLISWRFHLNSLEQKIFQIHLTCNTAGCSMPESIFVKDTLRRNTLCHALLFQSHIKVPNGTVGMKMLLMY